MGLVDGKVAFVTGAASGIGRASALLFAREGAKVLVADISVAGGEETVKLIRDAGGDATFVKCDVSKEADVQAAIKTALDTYGRLDCCHNNAGIEGAMTPCTELAEKDWDSMLDINLKGVWLCIKHEIPAMLANGGGAIVNTSSVTGLVGTPNLPAYGASKFGVCGLTMTAALENAQAGIRVNSVCPGVIHTALVDRVVKDYPEVGAQMAALAPMGRMGRPEEVAEAVVWLCSDRASYITGHNMTVDGGFTAR